MSFKSKLIAYSAAASCLFATLPVTGEAGNIQLNYKEVPFDSPQAKHLWGDRLEGAEMMSGHPIIEVADIEKDGVKLQISLLYASNMCNMNSCPIRIFQEGKMIDESFGCYNTSMHSVADSLRAMAACDKVIMIDRK